jgi:hypothetical protein
MTYKIWCTRAAASAFGSAASWLLVDGEREFVTTDRAEAEAQLKTCQRHATVNLSYKIVEVEE